MPDPITNEAEMIAGMTPVLVSGVFVFCSVTEAEALGAALPHARGLFAEAEGMSLILPVEKARGLGLPADQPMRQITLNVYSSLTGVGLTAAVSGALAEAGIPANVVAAHHHDHVFVPEAQAEAALSALLSLQSRALP
ncbi:ACT domain-containing protein [Pseudoroseicyclus tamaricis]|uniref:ACT domain-containing protein n=1 Tax=Pseudoroseicyclus tamaricis TaxID=2705421 RepID=A0A6B2JTH8_9RHOB|nr:ACT domain-containing protein [Pseudoroseicyclus tamaricis]NDV01867.1 ACT domain-containing protein [Pseudoroseicyclus tamaricis]